MITVISRSKCKDLQKCFNDQTKLLTRQHEKISEELHEDGKVFGTIKNMCQNQRVNRRCKVEKLVIMGKLEEKKMKE